MWPKCGPISMWPKCGPIRLGRYSLCMAETSSAQVSSLRVRPRAGAGDKVYWDADWRWRENQGDPWRTRKQRLGLAWLEPDGQRGWRKRTGRCREGWLGERAANVAAVAAVEAFRREVAGNQRAARAEAERKVTVRELAAEWLQWVSEVRGAKPSTIQDYQYLLREPGVAYRRGDRTSAGRIMRALGGRTIEEVTTAEVSRFLRELDRQGLTARNVNKHRQVLVALFAYGCRAETYELAINPAAGTDKRREDPPAALDYYEVEEVEALARVCEAGRQRRSGPIIDEAERAAREREDRQDAEAFRLLFYTGLRLGEVLTLRWEDVDLADRLLLVRRGLSAGEESTPKGRRHRFVPLSMAAAAALARLANRGEFIGSDDYVLANRFGRRLDPSALRHRYKRGCAAAGLRPVRLHGLRHAAGSLIARTSDPVFVRDFLGHAKLSTTDRYLSAKLRPEELERLDRAFAREPAEASTAESRMTEHPV
jgi:integrase